MRTASGPERLQVSGVMTEVDELKEPAVPILGGRAARGLRQSMTAPASSENAPRTASSSCAARLLT